MTTQYNKQFKKYVPRSEALRALVAYATAEAPQGEPAATIRIAIRAATANEENRTTDKEEQGSEREPESYS